MKPNAVIEPLTEDECEEIYYELSRYLGGKAVDKLTALYVTQKYFRFCCNDANFWMELET